MRYAIFTDVHANLEALEAVLEKIDELAREEPIDQIWFLGDLVGYGPNPNECIDKLREHTDVIIAGNHDWAAVGKIDLEDFSEVARLSAEWTAQQLTEEHREFLRNLPERIDGDNCVLVHGSPYGPLWEYLTSEVLAERSFEYFGPRFCVVGHTHVPVIFQQPYTSANVPTEPLLSTEKPGEEDDTQEQGNGNNAELVAVQPAQQANQTSVPSEHAHAEGESLQTIIADAADVLAEVQHMQADDAPEVAMEQAEDVTLANEDIEQNATVAETTEVHTEDSDTEQEESTSTAETTPETTIQEAEERLNDEIEELLALLGLSQSMISVTNEMIVPPEGFWNAPTNCRAIINPGGVGQPRDGDPRAAFMIYDTEHGFTFYRVPYDIPKTQEKIVQAGLPPYLAKRLEFGR